ncbi:MAG: RHS repeat-associated core domain-containing protein, partial [Eubacterium sp.]|nr:RHS repeat-associated core domain-containing protein [Eubacterium sp.]
NGKEITNANHIGLMNPIRYRGYYFDSEIGMYYLQSRYYNPQVGRFLNADGYVKTPTDSLFSTNMFAFCENNPVNKFDPTGNFAVAAAVFGGIALWKIGVAVAAAVAVSVATYIVVDTLVKNPPTFPSISVPKIKIKPEAKVKEKEKDIAVPSPPSTTTIYRYGGANPGNLTPKAKDKHSGLSFSTVPMPGAAMTTIEALNATGLVYAVRDGATHVSVKPIGGTVEDWINAGSSSEWTQAVKSVVIKWD